MKPGWLLCVWMCLCSLPLTASPLREFTLVTETLEVRLTPDAGGRVLHLGLKGQPNFLKSITTIPQPDEINENTGFIPFFGHEVWFGPQSQWWAHQSLDPKRKELKAAWPPDPFSSLSSNHIVEKNAEKIVMKSLASPVNGLEVEKTFALVKGDPRQIDLLVTARNARNEKVSWDIWFNSRSFATTRIFAPVEENVEVKRMDWQASIPYTIEQGLLSLKRTPIEAGKSRIMGKVMFQPSAGWFAAFNAKQLLIVQFPLQSLEKIHPEQGQLEFYMEHNPADESRDVLEMEVHSAYQSLAPGDTMQARERWTLIEYSGDDSIAAQRKFLREQLKSLKAI